MYIITVYIHPLHHLTYHTPLNDDVCCTDINIHNEKMIKIICYLCDQDIFKYRIPALTLTAFGIPMGYLSSLNIACCSFNESIYLHHKYEDHLCDVHNWCTYIVTLTSLSPHTPKYWCMLRVYIHKCREIQKYMRYVNNQDKYIEPQYSPWQHVPFPWDMYLHSA
jgi:hypothetical protein